MSSFVGHTLTGLGIYATTEPPEVRFLRPGALLWAGWLCFVALVPDVDYFIPALASLRSSMATDLRITHSIFSGLIVPALTILVLSRLKLDRGTFRRYSLQVCLVGLSHTVMDFLVGVWPLPLLWPLSTQRFVLSFGLLPAAPSFRLDNYYMYRNVLIEVGILVPLYAGIYGLRRARLPGQRWWGYLAWLWPITIGCALWASTLAR